MNESLSQVDDETYLKRNVLALFVVFRRNINLFNSEIKLDTLRVFLKEILGSEIGQFDIELTLS